MQDKNTHDGKRMNVMVLFNGFLHFHQGDLVLSLIMSFAT